MKYNQTDRIDDQKGSYIILADYHNEGLVVASQHRYLEDALKNVGATSQPEVIVKLVEFTVVN